MSVITYHMNKAAKSNTSNQYKGSTDVKVIQYMAVQNATTVDNVQKQSAEIDKPSCFELFCSIYVPLSFFTSV